MALQFDNKISTGHLLTAAGMLAAGLWGYAGLWASQEQLAREMEQVKATLNRDMEVIQSDAVNREARLRAVEVAQASQSSDLRNIQMGISDIKSTLEKMGGTK